MPVDMNILNHISHSGYDSGFNRDMLIEWVKNTYNITEEIAANIVDTINAAARNDDAMSLQRSNYIAMMANSFLKKIHVEEEVDNGKEV